MPGIEDMMAIALPQIVLVQLQQHRTSVRDTIHDAFECCLSANNGVPNFPQRSHARCTAVQIRYNPLGNRVLLRYD